jgi:hypothetical protein
MGCSTKTDDIYDIPGTNATGKDLPAGATVEDCLALVVSGSADPLKAYCPDADGDTYVNASVSDPFHTGCFCIYAGTPEEEWIEVTSTEGTNFGDCNDESADVTDADVPVYTDSDGDSYGTGESFMACGTEGYATIDGDCDDDDIETNPDATEECNGLDDNCDGDVDEDVTSTFFVDDDDDGYGDPDMMMLACSAPEGYVSDSTDCNDLLSAINPGATEICDTIDNDCDLLVDAADSGVELYAFYRDTDTDGYGDIDVSVAACSAPEGYVSDSTDCNDSNIAIYPGASEVCNGVNDNCDSEIDEGLPFATWYADSDSDGYGDSTNSESTCDGAPTGFIADDTDCNDLLSAINPGATEICDTIDNDCDTAVDEGDVCEPEPEVDTDGDGDPDITDCQPTDSAIYNGAPEACNGIDDDCDGAVDEGLMSSFYLDMDDDGYGSGTPAIACSAPEGYVSDSTDCDDGNSGINPAADEVCNDMDDDCDDSVDEDLTCDDADADSDGFTVEDGDCNDLDAEINPDAEEVSMNGVDDNCDGLANVSDTLEICVTPVTGLMSVSWQLWIRDWTVIPDGSLDPDWDFPGYAQGFGMLCTDFLFVHGHTVALNGPFDNDADGTYGEEHDFGDGTWLYQDVDHCEDVTLEGVSISPLPFDWGWGYDGHAVIDLY